MGCLTSILLSSVFGAKDIGYDQKTTYRNFREAKMLRSTLRRPLVIGASVSAEYFTQNPVNRLFRILTLDPPVRNFARFGVPGRKILRDLPRSEISASSWVAGVDLFFWDTVYPPYGRSIQAVHDLCAFTKAIGVPLLLGTAPRLSFSWLQPGHRKINEAIREACDKNPNCTLLDMDAINEQIKEAGGFELRGEWYPEKAVAPDGLHLSSAACEYLAEKILKSLRARAAARPAA